MKTVRSSFQNHRERHAFTLTELLVIVAILGLLVIFRLPAHTATQKRMKVVQCRSNLKQFTYAMHIYGNENNDKLPALSPSGGFWPWDVPFPVGTFVERTGANWRVMYCPGNNPPFTDVQNLQLYNYSGYRVLGYVNTFPGTAGLNASERNTTLTPQPLQVGFNQYHTPLASERVLLADVTISTPSGQTNLFFPLNWDSIMGGYPLAHRSAHLDENRRPLGCNVSMLDGHVEWRRFNQLVARTASGFGGPVFWW